MGSRQGTFKRATDDARRRRSDGMAMRRTVAAMREAESRLPRFRCRRAPSHPVLALRAIAETATPHIVHEAAWTCRPPTADFQRKSGLPVSEEKW